MSSFDEIKYLAMKKNEIKIFNEIDHGKVLDNIMQKDFDKIKNFPYNCKC